MIQRATNRRNLVFILRKVMAVSKLHASGIIKLQDIHITNKQNNFTCRKRNLLINQNKPSAPLRYTSLQYFGGAGCGYSKMNSKNVIKVLLAFSTECAEKLHQIGDAANFAPLQYLISGRAFLYSFHKQFRPLRYTFNSLGTVLHCIRTWLVCFFKLNGSWMKDKKRCKEELGKH